MTALLNQGSTVDHFTVGRSLGRGGMSEVYLARDTKLGRKVAQQALSRRRDHPRTLDEEGRDVLDKLLEARLIVETTSGAEARMLELAHGSLIAGWQTLDGWVSERAEQERWRGRVETAAERWARDDESEDQLWTGTALEQAMRILGDVEPPLSEGARRLLEASEELALRRQAELEVLGEEFDAVAEARTRRLLAGLLGGLWTFVPPATMQLVDPTSERYGPIFVLPLLSIVFAAGLCVWKWPRLKRTALNRWTMATVFLALGGQLAIYVGGYLMGLSVVSTMTMTIVLWSLLAAMLTVTMDLALAPVPIGYLLAFLPHARWPPPPGPKIATTSFGS